MSVWAIVLACGKEQEIAQGVDVAFLALGPKPVLAYSLHTLQDNEQIDGIVLVIKKDRVDVSLQMIRSFGIQKVRSVVAGSGSRLSNLKKAAEQIPNGATVVMVHDAARPFVTNEVITETVKAGKRYGVAVAAVRSADAVKLAEKGQKVTRTLDRNAIWLIQSPQVLKRDLLEKALKSGAKLVDDESALLEKTRQDIHLVVSTTGNMRIRSSEDLALATMIVNAS